MAKKNSYEIAYLKGLARASKQEAKYMKKLHSDVDEVSGYVVPQVYACTIKAMVKYYGWTSDQVVDLMDKIKDLWNESVYDETIEDMVEWAEKYADIDLHFAEERME